MNRKKEAALRKSKASLLTYGTVLAHHLIKRKSISQLLAITRKTS
jgi:hypothetical protein